MKRLIIISILTSLFCIYGKAYTWNNIFGKQICVTKITKSDGTVLRPAQEYISFFTEQLHYMGGKNLTSRKLRAVNWFHDMYSDSHFIWCRVNPKNNLIEMYEADIRGINRTLRLISWSQLYGTIVFKDNDGTTYEGSVGKAYSWADLSGKMLSVFLYMNNGENTPHKVSLDPNDRSKDMAFFLASKKIGKDGKCHFGLFSITNDFIYKSRSSFKGTAAANTRYLYPENVSIENYLMLELFFYDAKRNVVAFNYNTYYYCWCYVFDTLFK